MSTSPPADEPLGESFPPAPPGPPWGRGLEPYIVSPARAEEVVRAVLVERRPVRQRRFWLPLFLFFATCATTFLAGCYHWFPVFLGEPAPLQDAHGVLLQDGQGEPLLFSMAELIQRNWRDGLLFMVCVMGMLMMHEMGHFLMAHRHRIPASYPFFIPLPVMITGTMGAVIGMEGSRANRKQLFDIGLAGPLAGLIPTIPLVIVGILMSRSVTPIPGEPTFGAPLLVQLIAPWLIDLPPTFHLQLNPVYMAGWVGMLVTGLNMMPVSQLDGGHVAYAILGRYSRWLGRGLLALAVFFIVYTRSYNWTLMLLIVILIGMDHPRTADDHARLGPLRYTLGIISLLIPILCFTPVPMGIAR